MNRDLEYIQGHILEAIISENAFIDKIKDIDDMVFPQSYYREIFKAMKSLYKQGKNIDLATINLELNGVIPISEMLKYVDASWWWHGKTFFESCINILINNYMGEYIKRTVMMDLPAEEQILAINKFKAKYTYTKSEIEYLNDIWNERLEKEKEGYFDRFARLGIPFLDERIKIIREDLVVIGARPAVGKSSLGMQIIANLSRQNLGKRFIYFNLEMGKYQVEKRLNRLKASQDLMIYNESKINISRMREIIEEEEPLAIVIDQLNKVFPDNMQKSIRENFVIVANELKAMAKDYKIVIFCLAQLNRNTLKNESPRMSDFKESGSVEEEADIVLLLDRNEESATIHCDKYRNGATFQVGLKFNKESQVFG